MLRFILLSIVAFSGFYLWSVFPINHGPGEIAPNKPKIERIGWEKSFYYKSAEIIPKRKISGEVRILERKRYFFDGKSQHSPIDVLVGWNEMSDERNIEHLRFKLEDRYFDLGYSKPPLPLNQIFNQINLWHLIGSTEEIDKKIKGLRKGNIMQIEGFIVDIDFEDNYPWKSELKNRTGEHLNNTIIWITNLYVH